MEFDATGYEDEGDFAGFCVASVDFCADSSACNQAESLGACFSNGASGAPSQSSLIKNIILQAFAHLQSDRNTGLSCDALKRKFTDNSPSQLPPLCTELASSPIFPILCKETELWGQVDKQVKSMINPTQKQEAWKLELKNCDCYRLSRKFDFHRFTEPDELGQAQLEELLVHRMHLLESDCVSVCSGSSEDAVLQVSPKANELSPNRGQLASTLKLYQTSDLAGMSLDQLKQLVEELDLQVNINSEYLLKALDLREELTRDIEAKNSFIAVHVAVEELIKSSNARRSHRRRGVLTLFRSEANDNHRALNFVIPYVNGNNGLDSESLQKMTEILKAILAGDHRAISLISSYVLFLGDRLKLENMDHASSVNGDHTSSSPDNT